jgi:uncharacterized protein YuzE
MKTSYDKSTDSLYVEVRPLPSCRTIEIEEDIMLDLGTDGRSATTFSMHRPRRNSSHA